MFPYKQRPNRVTTQKPPQGETWNKPRTKLYPHQKPKDNASLAQNLLTKTHGGFQDLSKKESGIAKDESQSNYFRYFTVMVHFGCFVNIWRIMSLKPRLFLSSIQASKSTQDSRLSTFFFVFKEHNFSLSKGAKNNQEIHKMGNRIRHSPIQTKQGKPRVHIFAISISTFIVFRHHLVGIYRI